MPLEIEENKSFAPSPATCQESGKECRNCVANAASVVALLCPTLDVMTAQRTFFRLYPSPGCAPAARMFVRKYLDSAEAHVLENLSPVPAAAPYLTLAATA